MLYVLCIYHFGMLQACCPTSTCIIANHAPYTALYLQPNLFSHQTHWLLFLGAYDLAFDYLPGVATIGPGF